jgi:hypothetical protein
MAGDAGEGMGEVETEEGRKSKPPLPIKPIPLWIV